MKKLLLLLLFVPLIGLGQNRYDINEVTYDIDTLRYASLYKDSSYQNMIKYHLEDTCLENIILFRDTLIIYIKSDMSVLEDGVVFSLYKSGQLMNEANFKYDSLPLTLKNNFQALQ